MKTKVESNNVIIDENVEVVESRYFFNISVRRTTRLIISDLSENFQVVFIAL